MSNKLAMYNVFTIKTIVKSLYNANLLNKNQIKSNQKSYRPHFNHRLLHTCIHLGVICTVYIFTDSCWIVYVHKREYYIKMKNNKAIGLKQFII